MKMFVGKKMKDKKRVFFSFHGTGGEAGQLYDIVTTIDPTASYIGVEGDVLEGESKRYFKRYKDGTADLKSLARATTLIYRTLKKVIAEENLEQSNISLIGFSNGANVISDLLKEYDLTPLNVVGAYLFHPVHFRKDVPFRNQPDLRVFLTAGDEDVFTDMDEIKELEESLSRHIPEVKLLQVYGGHELRTQEIIAAKEFYDARDNKNE